jgi:hypothetical protein
MAILLENNLDVGPVGTTISVANSDDNGDNAFDTVDSAGTGAVCRYVDAVNRPTAAYVAEFATGNSARSPSVDWTTSLGQQTHYWTRFYARYNTTPPSGYASPVWLASQGSTAVFSIGISDTDPTKWRIKDEQTGFTGDLWYTINLGEWVRIEAELYIQVLNIWAMFAYLNAGDQVDEDTQASQLIQVGGSPSAITYVDTLAVGCPVSHSHYEPVQVSGLAVSTDGWIGPAPRQVKGMPGIQPNFIAPHTDIW